MFGLPNYFWFLSLSSISLVLLLYTFIKNRQEFKTILSVYFFISGLSFLLEFIVLVCLNAYTYYPNLIESKWLDSIAGSFTSQAIAVPAAGVFIAAFHLRWKWTAGFSLIFAGIELLFLRLHIYVQHWWSVWYTVVLLFIGFLLAKKWYKAMDDPGGFIKFSTIYLGLNTYSQSLKFFFVVFLSSHRYRTGIFSDPDRDSIFGNSVYLLFITVLMAVMIVFRFKWYFVVFLAFTEWSVSSWLVKNGFIIMESGWRVEYFTLLFTLSLLLFRWIYLKLFDERGFFD